MQKLLKIVFGTKYGSDFFANINFDNIIFNDDQKKEEQQY